MSFPHEDYLQAVHAARADSQINVEADILDYREDSDKNGLFYLKLRFMGRVDVFDFMDGGTAVQKEDGIVRVFESEIVTFDETTGEVVVEVVPSSPRKRPDPGRRLVLNPPDFLQALDKFAVEICERPNENPEARFCGLGDTVRRETHSIIGGISGLPLRSAQADALNAAMNRSFSFIWGPPGTGKSYTLGYIVAALRRAGRKVLVLAHTNTAVDVTTFAIDDACAASGAQLGDGELVRYARRLSNPAEYGKRPHLLAFTRLLDRLLKNEMGLRARRSNLQHELVNLPEDSEERKRVSLSLAAVELSIAGIGAQRKEEIANLLRSASVVCASTTTCLFNKLLEKYQFDAVVVDEASLIPLAVWPWLMHEWHADSKPRFVVAGDPMQLQPIFKRRAIPFDDRAVGTWFERNLYSYLGIASMQSAQSLVAAGTLVFLNEQFRMAHGIRDAVSRTFYDGNLIGDALTVLPRWPEDSGIPNGSVIALDPSDWNGAVALGRFPPPSGRNVNADSLNVTMVLVRRMIDSEYSKSGAKLSVLVVTPFRNQRNAYEKRLMALPKPSNVELKSATVHTCQGAEADVVFFDLVDPANWFVTRPDSSSLWCVACSRAKSQLFLIGDESAMRNGRFSRPMVENIAFSPSP